MAIFVERERTIQLADEMVFSKFVRKAPVAIQIGNG